MSGNHGAIEYTRKFVNAHAVGLMSAPPWLRRSVHPTDARREHPVVPADELRALLRDCHPNVLIVVPRLDTEHRRMLPPIVTDSLAPRWSLFPFASADD
jgi:hypothetical protein